MSNPNNNSNKPKKEGEDRGTMPTSLLAHFVQRGKNDGPHPDRLLAEALSPQLTRSVIIPDELKAPRPESRIKGALPSTQTPSGDALKAGVDGLFHADSAAIEVAPPTGVEALIKNDGSSRKL